MKKTFGLSSFIIKNCPYTSFNNSAVFVRCRFTLFNMYLHRLSTISKTLMVQMTEVKLARGLLWLMASTPWWSMPCYISGSLWKSKKYFDSNENDVNKHNSLLRRTSLDAIYINLTKLSLLLPSGLFVQVGLSSSKIYIFKYNKTNWGAFISNMI